MRESYAFNSLLALNESDPQPLYLITIIEETILPINANNPVVSTLHISIFF